MFLSFCAIALCAQGMTDKAAKTQKTNSMETGKKVLVAFFSHTGENYAVGNIPFCTHEGSGLSNTEKYIANACKGAEVEKGLAVRGATAQNKKEQARKTVDQWLERLVLKRTK